MTRSRRERWLQVRSVFERVFDLPESEREARLGELCDGDEALREEVRALLGWDARAASFLETPPGPVDSRSPPVEAERLGPYRLESLLGRGGMGAVWLARRDDGLYEQAVAVKVLHRGLDSAEAVARFRSERQILALLEHPHIARLLDGGTTPDGRPYLVIERVEGVPIDRWCDRRELAVEARLRLFLEVCRAVSFAHRHLVVHRDLKPANILIDDDGRPRLLDFGIAKLLDDEPWTRTAPDTRPGLVPMTPEYASPEQASGGLVTAQSDIYSLGVVLHELLTGRLPYRLGSTRLDELVRAVREQPTPWPSAVVTETVGDPRIAEGTTVESLAAARGADPRRLSRRLAGDLDNIVRAALRKDPERRYASVENLARDIELHLAGHPVTARPDTMGYRTRKFVGRHRWGVAATAGALTLLVALLVGLLLQRGQLLRQRNRAEAVSGFLVDVFAQPDPEHSRGETVTARQLLDDGATRIDDRLRDQPAARADLLLTLGRSYRGLGLPEAAEPLLTESLELRRRLAGPGGSAEVVESLHELAELAAMEGRLEDAARWEEEAVTWLEGRRRPDPAALSASLLHLGRVREQLGRWSEAETRFDGAVAAGRRAGRPDLVAEALDRLGILRAKQGRSVEAEALYREALALQIGVYGERHPEVALVRNDLGLLLLNMGEYEAAEALLLTTRRDQEALFESRHPHLGTTLNNLGLLRLRQGRLDEAEALLAEALAMQREYYDEPNPRIAATLHNQGELAAARGRVDEAETAYRRALAQRRAALPKAHPDIAATLHNLGLLLALGGRLEEARPLLEESLTLSRERLGTSHAQVGTILGALAQIEQSEGHRERAEARYRQALSVLEAALGPVHPELAATHFNLGTLHREGDDLAAAEESFRRSLDMTREIDGPDHLHTAMATFGLADLLAAREDWAGAGDLAATALPVFERDLEPGNVWLDLTRMLLARSLMRRDRDAEARPLLTRVIEEGGPERERARELLARLDGPAG